jgi:riboflavin kinase/FMN adenylyltransferase
MQVVTIGNFDGVHRGHQAIVALAASLAGAGGGVTAVTFEPLPAAVLRPGDDLPRLTTSSHRAELLRLAGCSRVIELDPSTGLLALDPAAFIAHLRSLLHFDAIVEGADFRFGNRRAGTVDTLRELGNEHGFRTVIAPEFETALADGQVVAPRSTAVRWLLGLGRAQDAARLLGRSHAVEGTVEQGDQRGRTLGFPTANVSCAGQLLPADGVYSGLAHTPHGTFRAALSVGIKPTFRDCARACEAYILDFPGAVGEYGWPIRVCFDRWLREQWKFPDVGSLVGQLHRDVAQCA